MKNEKNQNTQNTNKVVKESSTSIAWKAYTSGLMFFAKDLEKKLFSSPKSVEPLFRPKSRNA